MPAISPDFATFRARFEKRQSQLVYCTSGYDLETPVAAACKLSREGEPFFLLESVTGGENLGRYSLLGVAPDLLWRCHSARASMAYRDEQGQHSPWQDESQESLASLRALIARSRMEMPEDLPPMACGLIGFFGYDMVRQMERLPSLLTDPLDLPDAFFLRPRVTVVFDAVKGAMHLATPVWGDTRETSAEAAYQKACRLIETTLTRLHTPLPQKNPTKQPATSPQFSSNTSRNHYHAMVMKAKEHIAAGDIFQIVPSLRFSADFTLPPLALYRALRHLNPSPFLFLLGLEGMSLIGSSPEILVRLRDDTVTIRPIAGTRPRGKNAAEDVARAEELLHDPKEIAEHLMLLDLGRNDVGRVTIPGSVKVTQRMAVERYSHVMHLVSNVEGRIAPQVDAMDALIAGFPAGTVSGAPKIRAMEILETLEQQKRGFYAGCVGYFAAGGSMDTCITLRTGLIKDGKLHVQAGGGVVADSDPESEYQESCNKARALMRAAEDAWRFV